MSTSAPGELSTARNEVPDDASGLLAPPVPPGRSRVRFRLTVASAFVVAILVVLVLAAIHLTQGTADVGLGDLLRLVVGGEAGDTDRTVAAVLVASRLPRLLAGLLVGVSLGAAGAALQSVARNPLASPDTLAVNAGAYVAVVGAAVIGVTLPFYLSGTLALVGGLAASGLVLVLARGGAAGPTRLILAGSAITLALHSLTTVLLVLFQQETMGLFAWGSGSIVQSGTSQVALAAPLVVVGLGGLILVAHRLDLLALGDDTATVLGIDVRATRVVTILLAVLLSATAVTVAGPVGFVGLCAPVIVRLVARKVPGLNRHRVLIPLSGIAGVIVILGADVLLRLVLPGTYGVAVPTGVITTVFGAATLVWLARRLKDSGPAAGTRAAHVRPRTARRTLVVTAVLVALLVAATIAALLLGDRLLLTGDVLNWAADRAGKQVAFVLDQRFPRALAAILAGAALGLAGTVVQAVCRNPLAEPGLLGVTAGAGLGAVAVVLLVPGVGIMGMSAAAVVGALGTFAIVYRLAYRGGLSSDRLVLIGIGMSAGATALTTLVIVVVAPWNLNLALTWLSGSTYGRTLEHVVPVVLALLVVVPVAILHRREMDVLALDEDTPRVLGLRLDRTRLLLLGASAVLTAAAVCAVGVVGFVGLVAPHAARALVGSRNGRVIPVSMLLGAVLVSVADTVGRTVIAPAQIPAGLTTALIGAPYFVWLLWRSRGREA
ncbi:iron ABC transporter permease [Oerskovia enterophila]|uniref:Iron(3+)-hydroxamate import system permease protein FhuB n=1 Tax=Oerskovia enterophila TaxID=43678 RepID=A0A163QES4_9CELL|nr:iron ABC transporter permease [Oerskovia enterophila]KZM34092.1 iron(3+)-hydroxamate import system permease protein FhuB [Oerskovia enterophila]